MVFWVREVKVEIERNRQIQEIWEVKLIEFDDLEMSQEWFLSLWVE